MDDRRRTALAIALLIAVAFLPSLIFKPSTPPPPSPPAGIEGMPSAASDQTDVPGPDRTTPPPASIGAPTLGDSGVVAGDEDRLVFVRSDIYEFAFSTRGARLVGATLNDYESLSPTEMGLPAQLVPANSNFLSHRFVLGNDTVPLADWHFEPSEEVQDVRSSASLTWTARRNAVTVTLTYTFDPDHYVFDVEGRITGLSTGSGLLLIGLGPRLREVDADSKLDIRSYAVVTKNRKTEKENFRSIDPGERLALTGPFEWVAIKSKYFVAGALALDETAARFGGALAVGRDRVDGEATELELAVTMPVSEGRFRYSMYVGPQEQARLGAIGHSFDDINPYGWIFRPIIGPFAHIIVKILVWGNSSLGLAYGWILIGFGIAIRLVMWPLQQKSMRSQMAMQELQPQIEAIKKKHPGNQQQVGVETMALYKERGVNPLGGCLPMMLPMPFLFAFFFVFQNTIELRGASFLWLPDLSRADPIFIIPILMGLSMFVSSKVSQVGIPPNPQTKMFLYVMPIMLTVLFFNFASGLNLYYATQNLAGIPQALLLARERLRRKEAGNVVVGTHKKKAKR